jgi:hypothetical protein
LPYYGIAQLRMSENHVRQLIRHRLLERRLPRGRATHLRYVSGQGRECDGCGEPIHVRQKAVWGISTQDWASVRFHVDCYEIWEVERLRLARRDGDGRRGQSLGDAR